MKTLRRLLYVLILDQATCLSIDHGKQACFLALNIKQRNMNEEKREGQKENKRRESRRSLSLLQTAITSDFVECHPSSPTNYEYLWLRPTSKLGRVTPPPRVVKS